MRVISLKRVCIIFLPLLLVIVVQVLGGLMMWLGFKMREMTRRLDPMLEWAMPYVDG